MTAMQVLCLVSLVWFLLLAFWFYQQWMWAGPQTHEAVEAKAGIGRLVAVFGAMMLISNVLLLATLYVKVANIRIAGASAPPTAEPEPSDR